jgi:hypothetical protein
MARRLAVAFVCSVVALATVAVATPAEAVKPDLPVARGRVVCSISGKLKFAPALSTVAQQTKIRLKGTASCPVGVTGLPGGRTVGAKVSGTAPPYQASCRSKFPEPLLLNFRWRVSGVKVLDTRVAFHARSNGWGFTYPGGVVSGSYAGEWPFVSILTPGQCGRKGLAKSSFSGSIIIDARCAAPIPADIVPVQIHDANRPDDGHVWWVVASPCRHDATNHPTGTITWDYGPDPRNDPVCRGFTRSISNSGETTAAGSSVVPNLFTNANGFWGVDSGIDLAAGQICYGTNQQLTMRYSGDARYRPYRYVPWTLP